MIIFNRITSAVTQVSTDRADFWKCNGLVVESENDVVLIDCNFKEDEIRQIEAYTEKPVSEYFMTHMHIDHANNLHQIEKSGIEIHAPLPENRYLEDMDFFLKRSGAVDIGMGIDLHEFLKGSGFKTLQKVLPFSWDAKLEKGNLSIEAVPLPGHSDGHSGFIIRDLKGGERPVFFLSDLGLDSFGAWYGFDNADINDYLLSLEKVNAICSTEDMIIASSHAEPDFSFDAGEHTGRIQKGIRETEQKLLSMKDSSNILKIEDCVLQGVFYKKSSMDKKPLYLRRLYYLWEYFILKNHLDHLELRGIAEKISSGEWLITDKEGGRYYGLQTDDGTMRA